MGTGASSAARRARAVGVPVDGRLVSVFIATHARTARRLRLAVDGGADARALEAHLVALPWVEEARADPSSGRILLRYVAGVAFSERMLQGEPAAPAGFTPMPPLDRAVGRFLGKLVEVADRIAPRRRAETRHPDAPEHGWHAADVAEVAARLGTRPGGLTAAEARRHLERWGSNVVVPERPRTRFEIVTGQVTNLPTLLLIGSAALSLMLGDLLDAGAILTVVVLNAAIGYRIERKNEQLLASWQRLEAGRALVIRDGQVLSIPAPDLVPGDVLVVRGGDVVPADARVIDAHRLACDEAPLTGESEAQLKRPDPDPQGCALAERRAMLFAGSTVVAGRGRAVVVATGARTEVAGVRRLVSEQRSPETPLQKRLGELGQRASTVALGAAGFVTAVGLLRGRPLLPMVRGAVALAVASIPEGLPMVATAALVQGMLRMGGKGMVVRRVASADTLGTVTVVCIDKTGTLTRNEMRLEALEIDGARIEPETLGSVSGDLATCRTSLALIAGVLNSDIEYHRGNNGLEMVGSATERALIDAARRAGLDPVALRRQYPRRALHERQNGVHYVISEHDGPDGQRVAFVKGAPEQVLQLCSQTAAQPMDAEAQRAVIARNHALAAEGYRVLALAWRSLDAEQSLADGFDFIGLLGLRDQVRDGAAEAVQRAAASGIRTVVLTGDQRATAAAVARQVGIGGEVVEGGDIARRLGEGDPEALALLAHAGVFARVTPADKLAIVRALRGLGEVVAMAGDGINDAPALRAADVGIAVGAHATDVTRQTADVVLENADLRSILLAVGEGRTVQDNLRRAVRFLFASNLSEVLLMTTAAVAGATPLQPLQLLWLNLITDTFPALALALEPGRPEVLDRKPTSALLTREDWRAIGRDGALMAAVGGTAFLVGEGPLTLATLLGVQLGHGGASRAPHTPVCGRFVGFMATAGGLQLLAMLAPPLGAVLGLPALAVGPIAAFAGGLTLPLIVRAAGRGLQNS
jgi:Ca2+-transporting ATPase